MVFGKSKKDSSPAATPAAGTAGIFARLKQGLGKTRASFTRGLGGLLGSHPRIDDELLEDLETQLLLADVGVEGTRKLLNDLQAVVKEQRVRDSADIVEYLASAMMSLIAPAEQPLHIDMKHKPFVILMVGINGAGKTTTIGKLAKQLLAQNLSVMLAAGDTFRAAAVEQLQEWGRRNDVPVIAQQSGADPASVVYDALQSAQARGIDVLIADTAGRLHTQANLMEELKKIKRVLGKLDDSAPHEVMLVLDAGTGQNAVNQARQFHEAVGLTGITLTKLDGTARGGVLFAIAQALSVPIRYIGIGEGIEDLRPFQAHEFVTALLEPDAP